MDRRRIGPGLLLGTWRLVSFEVRSADGTVRFPYGRGARGYLIYNADGYMSVAFARADRPTFPSADPASGSTDDWLASAKGYTSYCGRWELRGDMVVHHVDVSLFPNWAGGTQERLMALEGNLLTLSTPPYPVRGEPRTGHLVWERVTDGSQVEDGSQA